MKLEHLNRAAAIKREYDQLLEHTSNLKDLYVTGIRLAGVSSGNAGYEALLNGPAGPFGVLTDSMSEHLLAALKQYLAAQRAKCLKDMASYGVEIPDEAC